jgi:predicted ATP-dependent protease
MKDRVAHINSGLRVARQEVRLRIGDLDQDLIQFAVASALHELRDRYAEVPQVMNYLDAVQEDAIHRVHDFKLALDSDSDADSTKVRRPDTSRYRVNLLVGNRENADVPVVVEANPTPRNLIGRIDHEVRQGALVTDMSMIRAGALHRANGGYLMIEAREVLLRPSAWDVLKRSLSENRIRMETMEEEQRAASTRSLAPEPIDLRVKVVLVGDEDLYQTLHERDEEFRELFKVKAEFETETRWDDDAALRYARFVGELCRREGLLPFDAGGVARWLEHASRLADDNRRLATRFGILADVAREAAHCAAIRECAFVEAADVRATLEARDRRVSRAEDRIRRTVVDGAIRIEVEGEVIGQVNGLVVSNTGDHAFGRPVRVTARTHVGMTGVVAIERETELGGRIHTKGVLTLAGFLGGLVANDVPLALSASLSLEQSYASVDGDSASSTELYALVSSLAELPARQEIAVTGAVDQRGQILAVGSVSEKVEGFYGLCRERGLTGEQGVMLPVANVHNLMLREDVVEAVAAGRFHVWAIDTVDEGLELLLGRPAGRRESDGSWTPDSVWRRVEDRLHELADHARSWTVSRR